MSEVRTVDIPNEARALIGETFQPLNGNESLARVMFECGIEGAKLAAPFIDRAARIDELSLMRSRFAEVEALSGPGDFVSWSEVRAEFATRLAELEAQR